MTPPPERPPRLGRRGFLIVSALTGAGLALGYTLRPSNRARPVPAPAAGSEAAFAPNAFIRIAPSGVVTLVAKQMEVGQGVKTSLPMILAEELEVDWASVVVEQGHLDEAYGSQFSAASTSTSSNYDALRRLGATARTMLVTAAAQAWGVRERECRASRGAVHHAASGRSLSYGELVASAAALPIPAERQVKLKDPKDFTLLGTRVPGVDNHAMITGQPLYGMDMQLPGMKVAVIARCPVFGGRALSANLGEITALPGVHNAFILPGTGGLLGALPGVAIVADSTWAALRARRQLKVEWAPSETSRQSTQALASQAEALARQAGSKQVRQDGNLAQALASAATTVDAWYSYPFICHAALEPLNCTATYENGEITLWTASQAPSWARDHIAATLNLPKEKVHIRILRGGGAFGRRLSSDYALEAAVLAQRLGFPVKLLWSREDDLQHDHFRAAGFNRMRAGLDAAGQVTAWHNHYLSLGLSGSGGVPMDPHEFPARWVENCTLEHTVLDTGIPTGAWRAPEHNVNAWVTQSFIDELAAAAGQDPLAFRLALLGDKTQMRGGSLLSRGVPPYHTARMRRVLQTAADKAGWGKTLPRGQAQGIAFHASFGGYVAQVAEVTVSREGKLRVDRVVCVCDVGAQIVNLSGAEAQVQGAVVDALSAAWLQEAPIEAGRAVASNFHDYPMLRMADAPAVIEAHFLTSDHPTSGLGEPAVPPLAPAVCNAIARATGHRVRRLPIARTDLSWT